MSNLLSSLSVVFVIGLLIGLVSFVRYVLSPVDRRLDDYCKRERGSADLGVMILIAVILIIAWGFFTMVKSVGASSPATGTYSVCTNPGQFWGDNQIDADKYETIYLGYCTPRGQADNTRRHSKESNSQSVESPVETTADDNTPIVDIPEVKNDNSTNDTGTNDQNVPADNSSDDKPAKEHKDRCDKGEGNGGENCDPGNHPEKGNDDENDTAPKEDKGKASLPVSFAGLLYLKFRKNRKDYVVWGVSSATVSHVDPKDLILYFFGRNDGKGMKYIPNARIIETFPSDLDYESHTDKEVKELLENS